MMRVRFPLPAPSLQVVQKGFALVAQLVEHTLGKGEVSGSNPLKSSIYKADMKISAFVLMVDIVCLISSVEGDIDG